MDYYNHVSKGYNELHGEEQLSKLAIIKNNIKLDKNTRLLDVGCGSGISSGFGCFVVGIDPSIGLLRQNSSNKKVLGIAESLPFRNDSFDYVISVTSAHNFADIEKSISEMKRVGRNNFVFSVLKKSGKFGFIRGLILKSFKVGKVIDEGKDAVFFCKKP